MSESNIKTIIDEIERVRSVRLDEIRDVPVTERTWSYLEGAITTLTDLLYFYYIKKEENNV